MSYPTLCASCAMGDHAGHVPRAAYPAGLIGGTHCACEGDCKAPDLAIFRQSSDDVLPGDGDRCPTCARVLPCTGSCPHCDWEEDR